MITRMRQFVGKQLNRWAEALGYHRNGGFHFEPISKEKVFCIGRNKTGTTSLKIALKELGYIVGGQRKAERLLEAYKRRNFKPFVEFCKAAEAFQDVPFSWPYTYVVMDQAFPESKFILTVRDSAEEHYQSWIRHQSQRLGLDRLPTPEELKQDEYVYPGWSYEAKHAVQPRKDNDLYNREAFIQLYERHNEQVKTYFAHRPNDLLVLNVGDPDAYQDLCAFLDKKPMRDTMPWKNKTQSS